MSARDQHQARLMQHKIARKAAQPNGNYGHSEYQWGVVAAINEGPPPTVDLYLNGTQDLGDEYLTKNVHYLDNYTPNMDDVVLVQRGTGKGRTSRVVLSNVAGSATPYQTLLGGINPENRQFTQGPSALWGGVGEPVPWLGNVGDYYFRTDTPDVAGQQVYQNTATSGWVEVLSNTIATTGVSQIVAGTDVEISPSTGQGVVTVSLAPTASGVTQLFAGTNVTLTPADGLGGVTINALGGGTATALTPTPIIDSTSSPYYANPGDYVVADTTSGGVYLIFPALPANQTIIAVAYTAGSYPVLINAQSTDVFEIGGGSSYAALLNVGQVVQFMYYGGTWYTISDDFAFNELSTWLATQYIPQSYAWSAGDLSGPFPNPTVIQINGTPLGTLSSATTGQVLTWNGSAWAPAAGGTGGVTAVSVASTHGFAGTSSGGSTPALTLSTSVGTSGTPALIKGDGTSLLAAVANTDYLPVANPTFTGVETGPAFKATGLTGASAGGRFVGAWAGPGGPASGTFVAGDYGVDLATPAVWVCTAGGVVGSGALFQNIATLTVLGEALQLDIAETVLYPPQSAIGGNTSLLITQDETWGGLPNTVSTTSAIQSNTLGVNAMTYTSVTSGTTTTYTFNITLASSHSFLVNQSLGTISFGGISNIPSYLTVTASSGTSLTATASINTLFQTPMSGTYTSGGSLGWWVVTFASSILSTPFGATGDFFSGWIASWAPSGWNAPLGYSTNSIFNVPMTVLTSTTLSIPANNTPGTITQWGQVIPLPAQYTSINGPIPAPRAIMELEGFNVFERSVDTTYGIGPVLQNAMTYTHGTPLTLSVTTTPGSNAYTCTGDVRGTIPIAAYMSGFDIPADAAVNAVYYNAGTNTSTIISYIAGTFLPANWLGTTGGAQTAIFTAMFAAGEGLVHVPISLVEGVTTSFPLNQSPFAAPGQGQGWTTGYWAGPVFGALDNGMFLNINNINFNSLLFDVNYGSVHRHWDYLANDPSSGPTSGQIVGNVQQHIGMQIGHLNGDNSLDPWYGSQQNIGVVNASTEYVPGQSAITQTTTGSSITLPAISGVGSALAFVALPGVVSGMMVSGNGITGTVAATVFGSGPYVVTLAAVGSGSIGTLVPGTTYTFSSTYQPSAVGTGTLTIPTAAAALLLNGMTCTGSGITGRAVITGISGGVVTIAGVNGGSVGTLSTSGVYAFTNDAAAWIGANTGTVTVATTNGFSVTPSTQGYVKVVTGQNCGVILSYTTTVRNGTTFAVCSFVRTYGTQSTGIPTVIPLNTAVISVADGWGNPLHVYRVISGGTFTLPVPSSTKMALVSTGPRSASGSTLTIAQPSWPITNVAVGQSNVPAQSAFALAASSPGGGPYTITIDPSVASVLSVGQRVTGTGITAITTISAINTTTGVVTLTGTITTGGLVVGNAYTFYGTLVYINCAGGHGVTYDSKVTIPTGSGWTNLAGTWIVQEFGMNATQFVILTNLAPTLGTFAVVNATYATPPYDGQRLTITNANTTTTNTFTFASGTAYGMSLGASNRAIDEGGSLELIFDNGRWVETGFNPGGF